MIENPVWHLPAFYPAERVQAARIFESGVA